MKRCAAASRMLVWLSAAACLAGCAGTEPYQRDGVWTPTGANAANLAAMLDNPGDLAQGRRLAATPGRAATDPLDLLLHDKVRTLIDTSSATTSASGSGSGASGSGQSN